MHTLLSGCLLGGVWEEQPEERIRSSQESLGLRIKWRRRCRLAFDTLCPSSLARFRATLCIMLRVRRWTYTETSSLSLPQAR